jgi:hypothetical protein
MFGVDKIQNLLFIALYTILSHRGEHLVGRVLLLIKPFHKRGKDKPTFRVHGSYVLTVTIDLPKTIGGEVYPFVILA